LTQIQQISRQKPALYELDFFKKITLRNENACYLRILLHHPKLHSLSFPTTNRSPQLDIVWMVRSQAETEWQVGVVTILTKGS